MTILKILLGLWTAWAVVTVYAFYIIDNSRNSSTIEFMKDYLIGITLVPVVIAIIVLFLFK